MVLCPTITMLLGKPSSLAVRFLQNLDGQGSDQAGLKSLSRGRRVSYRTLAEGFTVLAPLCCLLKSFCFYKAQLVTEWRGS